MKKLFMVALALVLSAALFFVGRLSAVHGAELVSVSGTGYTISFNGYLHDYT